MPRVLITGASGFAGQHLLESLQPDYSVLGLTSPHITMESTKKVTYFSGDICDPNIIQGILSKYTPQVIVHLAAQTTNWFNEPQQVFETNVLGTINLYEAVAKLKVATGYDPKILYISSSEAYGMTLHPELINEDSPFFPINHYASSKASADRVSYDYTKSRGLNIIIVRAFTHTGPRQKLGFFVPDMASQIAQLEHSTHKKEIFVGNLEATRDYLDIKDVVRAYKLVIQKDIPSGTALNVCSGKGIQVKQILEMLLSFSKKKITLKIDPSRMRPSDVPVFIGDYSRLHSFTGWEPTVDLRETLQATLNYWRMINVKE